MAEKIRIFFSYSHKDETLRDELEKYLSPLKRQDLVIEWYDRMIGAGEEWVQEVDTHLNTAHIILLLISPDFMASEYCHDVEVKRAMARHEAGEACVIPIILRPIYWQSAPFGKLQALPKNAKAVISWKSHDEAFFDVAEGIRRVVEDLRTKLLVNSPISEQKQDIPEKTLDTSQLYNALLTLNYHEQVRLFRQFLEQSRQVGAFMIHGEPSYGQSWLLHRLIRGVPRSSTGIVFPFSFKRLARGRSLEVLWRELAGWVGLKNLYSPQSIVEQVHKLWQTQTVILILHGLGLIEEEYLKKFVQNFWLPLAERARNVPCQSPDRYLLLFLVDDDGNVEEWNVAKQPSPEEPHFPIKLGKITPISTDELTSWIRHAVDVLPTTVTIQDILEGNDGIPELVLERICNLCGCDWYEREKVWIKY
jgi:hypothetical protein